MYVNCASNLIDCRSVSNNEAVSIIRIETEQFDSGLEWLNSKLKEERMKFKGVVQNIEIDETEWSWSCVSSGFGLHFIARKTVVFLIKQIIVAQLHGRLTLRLYLPSHPTRRAFICHNLPPF